MFPILIKCPRCRAINTYNTPYFWCYNNCRYTDKEDLAFQVNPTETEQREKVKEIIHYLFAHLFSQPVPAVIFPEDNIEPARGNACWGWVKITGNLIFLPRKSFYLPWDELVDLVVHEASHLLTQEKSHRSRVWYFCYRRARQKIFAQFADLVNSTNPQTRFQKGYKIYPSHYEVEYDELN